jgi:hypothetical protein
MAAPSLIAPIVGDPDAPESVPLGALGSFVARDDAGAFPASVDGGYPLVYYTRDGLTVCPACASKTDTSDPVVGADVFYEGADEACDDCATVMQSAYGDPDPLADDMAPPPLPIKQADRAAIPAIPDVMLCPNCRKHYDECTCVDDDVPF